MQLTFNLPTATKRKLALAVTLVPCICKVPGLNLCGTPAVLRFSEFFVGHSRQRPGMWNLKGCGGGSHEVISVANQSILTFTCSGSEKLLETSAESCLVFSETEECHLTTAFGMVNIITTEVYQSHKFFACKATHI